MTVKFNLLRPKDKTGKLKSEPVSITVTVCNRGSRKGPFATGFSIVPKYWNKTEARMTMAGAVEFNEKLSALKKRIVRFWESDKSAVGNELKGLVEKAIEGEDQPLSQKKTLIEAVQQFIAQYALEKETGTVKRYKSLLSKLTEFGKPIYFETLDHNFYDAFKKFLYSNPNPNYSGYDLVFDAADNCYHLRAADPERGVVNPVGLFDDVVFKYFINLKTVCKWAEKRGFQVHKAYKEWEIIKRDYDPLYLTKDELERLETVSLPKHLDVARDFLVLECRTGQRISDLKRFSRSDINEDVWTFKQKKGSRLTTKTISLPLVGYCAPALLILQKYNYELPSLSEQKINKYLKEACRLADIVEPLAVYRYQGNKKVKIAGIKWEFCSTHIGRKTAITQMLQSGMPVKMVMDITGIRSFKTLNHYNGKSEIGNIRKALEGMGGKQAIMKAV